LIQRETASLVADGLLTKNSEFSALSSATIIRRFGENAATIQRIIYDLAYGGSVWIDIHTVTGAQVTHNPFGRNLQRRAVQFRETACLYVVDSENPLIQR
jgi:hypothetical protein